MMLEQILAVGLALWAAGMFILTSHLLGGDGACWRDAGRRWTLVLDIVGIFWVGAAVGAIQTPSVVNWATSLLVTVFAVGGTLLFAFVPRRRRPAI